MMPPAFYDRITADLFRGSLPDWQKEPVDRLIEAGRNLGQSDQRIAYALATAYHETGRFKWMEEIGRGRGRDYGEPVTLIRGQTVTYHGRGFVQLTWLRNYAKASLKYGVDLVNEPDRAKEPALAARILWDGMIAGSFTGHNFADHEGHGQLDFHGSRKIINGSDQSSLIAGYAKAFLAAFDPSQDMAA